MHGRFLGAFFAFSVVATLSLGPPRADAQANNLVDLGVATGYAINNNGQVALDIGVYSNGTITPLPALPSGSTPASALAINATGHTAGSAIAPASGGQRRSTARSDAAPSATSAHRPTGSVSYNSELQP